MKKKKSNYSISIFKALLVSLIAIAAIMLMSCTSCSSKSGKLQNNGKITIAVAALNVNDLGVYSCSINDTVKNQHGVPIRVNTYTCYLNRDNIMRVDSSFITFSTSTKYFNYSKDIVYGRK
jgi:hypothetical protein